MEQLLPEQDGDVGQWWLEDMEVGLGSGCTGKAAQPHSWVFPQPPSPDELPANVKQAYRAFAAVPTVHPPENSATQVCAVVPCCYCVLYRVGTQGEGPKRNSSQV